MSSFYHIVLFFVEKVSVFFHYSFIKLFSKFILAVLDQNRILGEIEEQVAQVLSMVFENYKSLDESSPSGMMDVFRSATGSPAPALAPAVKLFTLLHDILSPESQLKLCVYFQVRN